MKRVLFATGAVFGFVALSQGCSSGGGGNCTSNLDCPYGQYCNAGVCSNKPPTSSGSTTSASTTTAGAAASTSTGGGSSTGGSSTGAGAGTTTGAAAGSTTGTVTLGYCDPCTSDAQCGTGNLCVTVGSGTFCGLDCSQTVTCPQADQACLQIKRNGNVVGEDCVPSSGSCSPQDGGVVDAGPDPYCKPCTSDQDCGPNNLCLTPDRGVTFFCGVDCAGTLTCAESGATCFSIGGADGGIIGDQCAPTDLLCPGADGGITGDPYCQTCEVNGQCGANNLCVSVGTTTFCAVDCSLTGTCTETGAICVDIPDGQGGVAGQDCVPSNLTCGPDPYCQPCTSNADCGGINLCLTTDGVTFFCGVDCSVTLTCSEPGAECDQIPDNTGGVAGTDCVPTSLSCSSTSDGGTVDDGGTGDDGGTVIGDAGTEDGGSGGADGGSDGG